MCTASLHADVGLLIDTSGIVYGAGSVKRWSVRLPVHQSTAAAVAGGFAAEHPASRRYRSIAVGASAEYQLQARSAVTAVQHGAQQQMWAALC